MTDVAIPHAVTSSLVPASSGELEAREELAALYRACALYGWDDLIANHITARVPGEPDAFLINPFGLLFEEVTASSLVKIDCDGVVLSETAHDINQTGFVIHSAVHMARPDAGCVVHLHSPAGVAVSMLDDGLLPLHQTAMLIAHDVATHEYDGVALDPARRKLLAEDLGDRHLMLLRNHGILTLGRTVADAFLRTFWLEQCCDLQLRAFAAGRPVHYARDDVVAATAAGVTPESFASLAERAWAAVRRKVDRELPGYAA